MGRKKVEPESELKFCPLIGKNGCREDCLFNLSKMPKEILVAARYVLLRKRSDEQLYCGLSACVSAALQFMWSDANETFERMYRMLEDARQFGAEEVISVLRANPEPERRRLNTHFQAELWKISVEENRETLARIGEERRRSDDDDDTD